MTNVTQIVEQDLERKRLASAIDSFPSGIMFWDENDELIIASFMNNYVLITFVRLIY